MQTITFNQNVNDLSNMIINNKLEHVFKIVETELIYTNGYKYSFYSNNKLINVFEVDANTKELDSLALYEYILGFVDSYLHFRKMEVDSKQNRIV